MKAIRYFLVFGILAGTNAEDKCKTAEQCEGILKMEDIENESIKASCNADRANGTCLIGYFKAITVNYFADPVDPPGMDCMPLPKKSDLKHRCVISLNEIQDQYPKFIINMTGIYLCKQIYGKKKLTFLTCAGSLTETKVAKKEAGGETVMPTTAKSGCVRVKECDQILTHEDLVKPGIFKTCYDIDKKCTTVCDRACSFSYAQTTMYNETMRNPNPRVCFPPKGDQEVELVKRACVVRFKQVAKVLLTKQDTATFDPAGFMCNSGGKKHIACVNQFAEHGKIIQTLT